MTMKAISPTIAGKDNGDSFEKDHDDESDENPDAVAALMPATPMPMMLIRMNKTNACSEHARDTENNQD